MKLSILMPVYNEYATLAAAVKEVLEVNYPCSFELLIVDDGSTDGTRDLYPSLTDDPRVIVRLHEKNQGKGGAVQQGMLHARGNYLLMADADGATRISDLDRLEANVRDIERNGFGIAVGSRAHLQEKAVAKRKWYRNILMYGFHFLVAVLCVKNVRDTQCGFKLFSRAAAQMLFYNQHLRRWSFDVELLYLAQSMGMPIAEVEVNWAEIPGSKLNIIGTSATMARDLLVIRLCYMFRIWRVRQPPATLPYGSSSSSSSSSQRGTPRRSRRAD